MSGHSKWATIKHKKGALDAKRGKIFTRLLREIAVAAKGGGNPDSNARLRTAVLAAKSENMPAENIKRAIQRGTGELEGVNYEEITFEGYGPGGVAVIVETLTDNRNRTVSEVRHAFSKNGGNLGESGSVRFIFSKKGVIAVEKAAATEDQLMDIVLEHGGEDLNDEGETWEIIADPAFPVVQVGVAHAARLDPDQSLTRSRLRHQDRRDLDWGTLLASDHALHAVRHRLNPSLAPGRPAGTGRSAFITLRTPADVSFMG